LALSSKRALVSPIGAIYGANNDSSLFAPRRSLAWISFQRSFFNQIRDTSAIEITDGDRAPWSLRQNGPARRAHSPGTVRSTLCLGRG
jgi:hypothetical protein